ncbi:MAG TPA: DUF255 domain-containing protein [Saprospiraceae bacterium]|nr:DUF255 domain-containing protein [Saprospiraceae bacterium]
MMIRFISIVSFLVLMMPAFPAIAQIKWLTWEEAQAQNKEMPKKIIVDVYTQWCGWCKKMDKATFENPNIASYINKNFYAVKFDAEIKTDINFKDKVYKFVRAGANGYHELAQEILFGRFTYPTLVFLDEQLNVIQPIPSYQDPASLDKIMKYFAENYYKTTPWKKYEEMYQLQHPVPVNGVIPKKD